MKTCVVIPARYASTRFPGKPLADLAGKPMVQWTYERAASASGVDQVLVATDDQRIFDTVTQFGGQAVMTSPDHPSGTDRIAEAIADLEVDLVVNVQGDEPLIPPHIIEQLIAKMKETQAEMGTVAVPISRESEAFTNPNVVKVVTGVDGYALYFSRASIPFLREGGVDCAPAKHWGIYAYTPDFVRKFVTWPEGILEQCEKLEQLRAMEHGTRILVINADCDTVGVDTPEDLEVAAQRLTASIN